MASRVRTVVGLVVAKIDLKMEPFFFPKGHEAVAPLRGFHCLLDAIGCTLHKLLESL